MFIVVVNERESDYTDSVKHCLPVYVPHLNVWLVLSKLSHVE